MIALLYLQNKNIVFFGNILVCNWHLTGTILCQIVLFLLIINNNNL
mgnify:CR=1 FL=1